jgi:hypothetical protein
MKTKEYEVIDYNSSNSRTILKTDSIVDGVIDKFIDRARVGKQKYGVTLDREDLSLSDFITHAQEELQDAILYLEKIKKIIS